MNLTAWNVVPVLGLLTLTAAPACTQATQASQTAAEKAKEAAATTKEAVVNGATTARRLHPPGRQSPRLCRRRQWRQ